MTIEWPNGWFYIGRAWLYGPRSYAIGWNNRAILTGEHPPPGEYMHADHLELLWHGGPSRLRRTVPGRWFELRRYKMPWHEVQR